MIQFVWMNMSESFVGWNYWMRMIFVLILIPITALLVIYPCGRLIKRGL